MKKKKASSKCHCCQKMVGENQMKKVASLFPFEGAHRVQGKSNAASIMAFTELYKWACDDCLETKRALLGNPKKQSTAFQHLAHWDKSFTCRDCESSFVFSKEEQQHWYEELKFVVYSRPVRCPDCRKKKREEKNLNTELSELLKDGKPEDRKALLRIAEIYETMGKPEKVKAYRKAAK